VSHRSTERTSINRPRSRAYCFEINRSTGNTVPGAFFTAPGFCTEYLTVYLATDLHPAEETTHPEDEDLEVVRMTLSEALDAVDAGEIEDAKSIVAILWLARRLGGAAAIGPSQD